MEGDLTDLPSFSTQEICRRIGGRLQGPGDLAIHGLETVGGAGPGKITFIGDEHHSRLWPASLASAALVGAGLRVQADGARAIIHVEDADLALAAVLELFAGPKPAVEPGVHRTAVVDPTCQLGEQVSIGPHCFLGPHVSIGQFTVLYANVTVLDATSLGSRCILWPGTVIRERCRIGDGCVLGPNVTIGADGFGYRQVATDTAPVKIPQIGTVLIGNQVEIGAGTCVDRGKFSATRIGDGTKIDNLCQIAHGCVIGRGCLIAAQCGIAGSVTIGDRAMLGGQVGLKDHVTVGHGVQLGGGSAVMEDVPDGAVWAGVPAQDVRASMRTIAAVRRLPDLIKTLKGESHRSPKDRPARD